MFPSRSLLVALVTTVSLRSQLGGYDRVGG